MAERRMFSMKVIDSDAFLEMPLSTQALYFHLSMRADDDGFVANPRKIRQMIGASDDDVKILISKRYILTFDSGVIVIKHWKIHNYIQKDRYTPTTYVEEKNTLELDGKNAYKECLDTSCIQNGYKLDTQVRLDKDRLVKDRIGECDMHTHAYEESSEFLNTIPTLEEIQEFIILKNYTNVDAQRFKDHYDSLGWKKGNTPITNWQPLVGMWEREQVKQDGLKAKEKPKYKNEFTQLLYEEGYEVD